ncbi:MAG TPA: segregation/condensation protein A [Candidatus Limnocylindrales bacterium]|nr:segregation/condensation protein A [Candidatus Limnocylindrales bacterium]
MTQADGMEPIAVEAADPIAVPIGEAEFTVALPTFEGPLQLLLHLIESRQLDVLTVPLAEVADAYVEHLARHPVNAAHLSEFVAIAAQLIFLKSKRMLPAEPLPPLPDGADEMDEDELRRRLLEYRALRDASVSLGERDGSAPLMRREPRESDLPEAPTEPMPVAVLVAALERLAAIPEPVAPPPEIVAREITIGQQIGVLREALTQSGRIVLQSILARCRSRTEAAVTFLATLELVRRRQVTARQDDIFGPIVVESLPESGG